jgi:hypothetical protein
MIAARSTAIICVAILLAQRPYAFAQQQPATSTPDQGQKVLSAGQLDSMVAPIALYPDPILGQILVASTYPLEIVEAARWLKSNGNLQGTQLTQAAAQQPWDASVQALVALPDVLNRLNTNITWTTDLGNTFLAQQEGVMDAIQRMRTRAKDKGALQSTQQQVVTTSTDNGQANIEIQPASPQVVYVPQYNPVAVWGPPPDYYPYPAIYYPPYYPSTGAVVAASAISFGVGVAIGAFWGGGWSGWGGWGWHPGWGHRNVVINNNFINNNHFNRVNVGAGNTWTHNPGHRGGVPYNNRSVANRFNAGNISPATRPTVGQTQQRLNQMSQRPGGLPGQPNFGRGGEGSANRLAPGNLPGRGGAAPGNLPDRGGINFGQGTANRIAPGGGGDRIGNRSIGGGGFQGGAFGGMGQGAGRTMTNSNRGFGSRGFGGGGGRGFGGGGFRGGGRRR